MDLLHFAYPMYKGLDHICGGQGKLYEKRWSIFLAAFETAGIELVFVADGARGPDSKQKTWKKHRNDHRQNFIKPVFASLVG